MIENLVTNASEGCRDLTYRDPMLQAKRFILVGVYLVFFAISVFRSRLTQTILWRSRERKEIWLLTCINGMGVNNSWQTELVTFDYWFHQFGHSQLKAITIIFARNENGCQLLFGG